MTKLLRIACAVALVMVALSAVAEPKGPEYAVVTCAEDGTELGGGKITLRDALGAMADPAFTNAVGTRVITFRPDADFAVKLASPLVIGEGTLPFAVDGGANDRCVTITSANGCRLIEHKGHGLELRNLQFEGGAASGGAGGAIYAAGPASATNQTLTVSNCAFSANIAMEGGAIAAESNTVVFVQGCSFCENGATGVAGAIRTAGRLTAVCCTFYANKSQENGAGAVAVTKGGVLLAAQCTCVGNVGKGGGVRVHAGATATVCDCLLIANYDSVAYETVLDLFNGGALALLGTGLSSPLGGNAPQGGSSRNDFDLDIAAIWPENPELPSVVNGVTNSALTVIYCAPVTNGAGILWHDAAWTNVAVAVGGAKTALCGNAGLATIRLDDDQTGRAERPARGAKRHDFVNRIRFVAEGQVVKSADVRCGSADLPTAPPFGGAGGVLTGWYSEPDGKGVRLWMATGEPDAANLRKVPYEPLVAYACLEMSDAAFTVSDGGDGVPEAGKATLRTLVAAMAAHPEWNGSAGRRVITVPAEIGTVALTRELAVTNGTRPFVIRGAAGGGTNVVICPQGQDFRLFRIENEGMGFENLTFQGAQSREKGGTTGGGAIWVAETCKALTVSNCAFRSNRAQLAGGAVRLIGKGTFVRCSFHDNMAVGDNAHGGAVSVDGENSATFLDCSFTRNYTDVSSSGGAVYCLYGGHCTFERCTFFDNRASNAGAVGAWDGVPAFTGCLAVSNSPSVTVSPAFTNMSGGVLSEGGSTFDLAVGGANHAYVRPMLCAAVTNAQDAAGGVDLLGRVTPVPGIGAVRSEYGIRFDLDPGEKGELGGGDRQVWGVCGRSLAGVKAPQALRSDAKFLGWWTGQNRTGARCFDASGNPDADFVAPFAGQMTLHAGWQVNLENLKVTTSRDVTDQPEVGFSLRDAINKIVESGPDGGESDITVTFELAESESVISLYAPLELPPSAVSFTIDGSNGNSVVTLGAETIGLDALIRANGRGLTLRNLMFSAACKEGTLVSTNGALTVENCAFDVSGRPVSATGASLVLRDGSFSGVTDPLVCHARTNTVVNCTVLGLTESAVLDFANDSCLLKSTVPGAGWTGSATAVDVIRDVALLAGTSVVTRCKGVAQVWCPALGFASLTQDTSWVTHDGDWSNIVGVKPNGSLLNIRGSKERAVQLLTTDQLGKAFEHEAKGAVRSRLAVRFDLNANGGEVAPTNAIAFCGETPDPLPVPTRDHYGFAGWRGPDGTSLFGPDGRPLGGVTAPWAGALVLTARWSASPDVLRVTTEAEFQTALRALADPDNDFPDRTITLLEPIVLTEPLKIAEGTKPFAIEGGGATINGRGGVQLIEHRGEGLTLRNLTLTGGRKDGSEGNAGGGAVFARGTLRAENCAFVSNTAGVGGALSLNASSNLLINCTFADNTAGSGGTISLSPDSGQNAGTSVMIHCTVVEKTANTPSTHNTIQVDGGNLTVLACSFVGSLNTNHVGRALCNSGTGNVTLIGSAFAGHPDSQWTKVEWTTAPVTVVQCTFSKPGLNVSGARTTTVENVFSKWTSPKSRTYGDVEHTCYPPALTEQMAGGVWVWHGQNWESIAYSGSPIWNPAEMQTVIGDHAVCTQLKSTDQTGLAFFPQAHFRGSTTAISATAFGLEVTTAEDKFDPTDDLVSLREAIIAAGSGQFDPDRDGRYTITFADSLFAATNAVTVKFDCTGDMGGATPTADIVIQGRTDGRSVALAVRNNQNAPAFKVEHGRRFALRNLTVGFVCTVTKAGLYDAGFVHTYGNLEMTDCLFEGCRQAYDAVMVWTGGGSGVATIERCSFVGSGRAPEKLTVDGGCLKVRNGDMRIIDCTFANLNLMDADGKNNVAAVHADGSGQKTRLAVVNCTFFGNKGSARSGGIYANGKNAEVCVLNCIFNDNRIKEGDERDVFVDNAWFRARGCVYSAMVKPVGGGSTQGLGLPEVDDSCEKVQQADKIFSGQLRWILRDGVLRAYRPPKLYGPADRHGFYVWHDAAWANVAVTAKYVNQTDKAIVVGTEKGLAKTLAGRYDVVGRDALEGINVNLGTAKDRQATMGSYTMPLDGETGEPGVLVVNTDKDDGTAEHDTYDGELCLREAVDFANTHPHWRDANGNCRVMFADDLFLLSQGVTIASKMRQMEVTAFTNGTLSVVGPESAGGVSGDMRSLTLDGQGRHRLFYVAPGNALSLANLNFTNAVSQKAGLCQTYAGGAINSKGRLEVRNCAFRDCRTFQNENMLLLATLGRAYGGAVCTEEDGSSVIERCTFQGCRAMAGGAVCTDKGGDTVLVASTFADNLAIRDGTTGTGRGGAVCALDDALRTALINCTLTRNLAQDAGGAIAAGRTKDANDRLTTALYLLDSIVLGNGATVDADSGDIRLEGKAKLAHCRVARRNAADNDQMWTDDPKPKGGAPSDIFGQYTTDGVAIETTQLSRGAWQTYFPLREGVDTGAAFVWTYDGWANVGYSPDKGGMRNQSVLYIRERNDEIRLKMRGEPMTHQQLGEQSLNLALMGAVERYGSQEHPVPVVDADPLRVTNGTFRAFCDALDYAATHTDDPALVSNGCLTITFAGNYTINVTSNLTLSAFTSPKLRIVGPVTFTGKLGSNPAFRPFLVAYGNALVLENVTFAECLAEDGFGGALCLEGAELTASNVTFSDCTAYSEKDEWGAGGAVAALYGSTAVFGNCTFDGNAAPDGDGQDVYRYESTATFTDCTFKNPADKRLQNEVVDWLNALLIRAKPDGRKTYFSTVAEALAQCHKGDTLVLLNPDGPSEALVREKLPLGVTLEVFPTEGIEEVLSFVQMMAADANAAFVAKSEPWYTATVRETDGLAVMDVGLNNLAKPGIGEVDFNAADGTAVSVWPTDVRPGLVYGLGRGKSPTGPFIVEEDGWVQADANGALPHALTASKDGDACFYRVIVR